jgi:hypothetical protein
MDLTLADCQYRQPTLCINYKVPLRNLCNFLLPERLTVGLTCAMRRSRVSHHICQIVYICQTAYISYISDCIYQSVQQPGLLKLEHVKVQRSVASKPRVPLVINMLCTPFWQVSEDLSFRRYCICNKYTCASIICGSYDRLACACHIYPFSALFFWPTPLTVSVNSHATHQSTETLQDMDYYTAFDSHQCRTPANNSRTHSRFEMDVVYKCPYR